MNARPSLQAIVCLLLSFAFFHANASTPEANPGETTAGECHANEVNIPYVCVDDEGNGPVEGGDDDKETTTDGTSIIVSAAPSSMLGNPVSIITGNKYQKEVEYQSALSKLHYLRHYNSTNSEHNLGLGQGWSSTLSAKITRVPDVGFNLLQGNGSMLHFHETQELAGGDVVYTTGSIDAGYLQVNNNQVSWTVPDGRRLKFSGSFLTRIDYPGSSFLEFKYKQHRISEITDEHGRVMRLQYYPNGLATFDDEPYKSAPGHLASITLPDGQVREYLYDSAYNLTRVLYSDGTHRTYHYENINFQSHLTGITNRNGIRYASWDYDNVGRAILSEHANKVESVSLEYFPMDAATGIGSTQITNSIGQISTYQWLRSPEQGQMVLLSTDGPGCVTCPKANMRYEYNDRFQVITATKVNPDVAADWLATDINDVPLTGESQTRFVYDEQGRLTEKYKKFPSGQTRLLTRREYRDDEYRPWRISRPSVNPAAEVQVEIEYNDDHMIKRISERGYAPTDENRTTFTEIEKQATFTYDNGLLKSLDGPRTDVQDITYFEYDDLGRLAVIDLPTGRKLQIKQYDMDGRATEFQIGNRSPLHIKYDTDGNISEISMRNETMRYEHDAESQLLAIVDPYGKRRSFEYDDAGRISRATDEMGLSVSYLRDTENRLSERSFFGLDGTLIKSINYAFDAENRLQSRQEQSNNFSTGSELQNERSLEYDELNRLVSISSANGSYTKFGYDDNNNISQINESGLLSAQLEYDHLGRLITETDARGNRTETIFDDFGRAVRLVSPDTGLTQFSYDKAGNRLRKQNAQGDVIEYEWDAGNRITKITSIDGVTTYEYNRDNGRISKTTNPDTVELFEYDPLAQLTAHTRVFGDKSFTTTVAYNSRGQVERKILPDGQSLRYHYHQDGVNVGTLRAITREGAFGLLQDTVVGEIDLEARDGQTGYLSHNGVRTQRQFHADGSIKGIEISDTLSLKYTFDDQGNISGIDENGIQQEFAYNGRKLVLASTLTGEYGYEYDAVGNRVASYEAHHDQQPVEKSYHYSDEGSGNRLVSTQDVNSGATSTYEYNNSGAALKAGDEFNYEYNINQRPIAVYREGELLAEYRYNSFGARIQKTIYNDGQGDNTYYLYEGHTLVGEVSDDGIVTAQYLFLQDRFPVAKLEGKKIYAIHTDHLGTPRKATDDKSDTVWGADYTPFGKAVITNAEIDLNLRFPGQYEDAETGTHYNYFRDYDPGTGRYITSDPIGLKAGVNTYAYASANPILATDVLGLDDDEVNDGNIVDKIKEFVLEAGSESVDSAINLALGENFVAVATQTLQQIPGEFSKLASDPNGPYSNLPVDALTPLFNAEAATDLAFTFAVLFTIKKGANLLGKTSIFSFAAKKLLEKLVAFGLKAYIVKEFGEAAGEFFDNIDQLADKIEDVADNPEFSCADTEEIAAEIARMLADVALHSADNLKNFFNKVKIKRKKDEPEKCRQMTNAEREKCYRDKISRFEDMGLDKKHIDALEAQFGKSSMCSN